MIDNHSQVVWFWMVSPQSWRSTQKHILWNTPLPGTIANPTGKLWWVSRCMGHRSGNLWVANRWNSFQNQECPRSIESCKTFVDIGDLIDQLWRNRPPFGCWFYWKSLKETEVAQINYGLNVPASLFTAFIEFILFVIFILILYIYPPSPYLLQLWLHVSFITSTDCDILRHCAENWAIRGEKQENEIIDRERGAWEAEEE